MTEPSPAEFIKFSCFGGCGYKHDTLDYARDTHKLDCGTARNIDEVRREAALAAAHGSNRVIATYVEATVSTELRSRDVDDGCGRNYWACNVDDREAHEKQTCTTSGCSVKYRNCLSHTKNHSNHGTSAADAGSSTDTQLADNSPDCDYCTTGMCSACPITYACGIHAEGTSGYHVSYTCNEGACNNRVYWGCVYAQCPETSSHGTTTITSGPAIGPCGHTYWLGSSSDYDHRSETWGCGHTIYVCQSSSHALQASCSITNIWGHSCTVTNFYACSSHTHTFPTFSCGRSACTQQVADPNRHRIWCINGHEYWSCDTTALYWHQTRGPCTRRKLKSPGVRDICGESWALCDRNGQSCMDYYRRIRFHEPRQ